MQTADFKNECIQKNKLSSSRIYNSTLIRHLLLSFDHWIVHRNTKKKVKLKPETHHILRAAAMYKGPTQKLNQRSKQPA